MSTRKEAVVINGVKRKLIYLPNNTYEDLFKHVEAHAKKLILKSRGQYDEKDPYKTVEVELKCFVFNDFVFAPDNAV